MKIYLPFLFLGLVFCSCERNSQKENPLDVAKSYCNCITSQLANAPDSSVNLRDCEIKIYAQSRFLMIYTDFDNYGKYDQNTIDSARQFNLQVRDIEDSLCYNKNKIDFKKVKVIPHAF